MSKMVVKINMNEINRRKEIDKMLKRGLDLVILQDILEEISTMEAIERVEGLIMICDREKASNNVKRTLLDSRANLIRNQEEFKKAEKFTNIKNDIQIMQELNDIMHYLIIEKMSEQEALNRFDELLKIAIDNDCSKSTIDNIKMGIEVVESVTDEKKNF